MTSAGRDEKPPQQTLYNVIIEKLESLAKIKFAAYRVACKLRVLQKYLKLCYVDYNVLVRAFDSNGLQFGIQEKTITFENAQILLTAVYQLISSHHFTERTMKEIVDTLLRFLYEIFNVTFDEDLDLNSFKIILFTLSNGRLPDKYRSFFRQITSPDVIASQSALSELFDILLKLPNHFDNVDSFHSDNIPACIQSCLTHVHDGVVREDVFVSWMHCEPQTLVWLPTLHRLIATETVRHEAQCNVCKAYPIIGMRYRCLKCFNFDLCQTCFFTGDHGRKHDGSHPIEEYCKQVTPFEDLKALCEFFKLKVGKRDLKRKERYLTIERSKSSSSFPNFGSNQLATVENQQEQVTNRSHSQDAHQSMQKTAIHDSPSHHGEKNGVITVDKTSPRDEKKKMNNDANVAKSEPIKPKELNYITVEKKKISSNKAHASDDEDAPMLMPKQHKPIKKQKEEFHTNEHYQSPVKIKEKNDNNEEDDDDDDDDRPPLPPKLRKENNVSRALVYDFIGNELQELRATLAQFDQNTTAV